MTQTGVRLDFFQLFQVPAQLFAGVLDHVGQPQVEQVVFETAAKQELHAHVKDLLFFFVTDLVFEIQAFAGKDIPDHQADRVEHLTFGRIGSGNALITTDLFFDQAFHFFDVNAFGHSILLIEGILDLSLQDNGTIVRLGLPCCQA